MRLLILSRNKKLHSIRRLLQEAKKAKIQADVVDPLDCQLMLQGRASAVMLNGVPLPHYDAVLPRIGASITDYGLAVVRHFEALDTRTINSSKAIGESRNKMRALQIMTQVGLHVPVTALTRRSKNLRSIVEASGGLPVVLKMLKGTQGVGVMLIHTPISLGTVLETFQDLGQDVLIQQFIAEGAGRDYRALVIGSKVFAAMMRKAPEGEFRSNIHRGGEGTLVKLPPAFEKAAIKACRVLGLEVAGVDLMESTEGPVILEVNSSPGFEGIEKATGLNIAGAIVKHIKKGSKRKR
jgi:ribosomal protein S6--L-glutamate ligase